VSTLLIGLALGGCGSAGDHASSGAPPRAAAVSPPAGPATLTPVTPDGIRAAARQPGARATLVNVWASWCMPCREEFPELMRVVREERDRGLRVLLVSADFDSAAARAFLASQKIAFPTYIKT